MEDPRMGRSKINEMDDWELAGPATGVTTLVLVGRTGNGKSATGNSILGRRAFKSRSRSSAVTLTSELQQVQMKDGRILNVVDTPGLFDLAVHPDFLGKEIVKCIDLAKHGVHGVLFVLSVRNRFTAEEAAALESLQMLFGEKILRYMVVTFTGGDELEDNQETLEDYLHDSPLELQERLSRQEDINSGGYSKEEIHHLKKQLENAYAEQLKQLTEMVEEKLRITTEKLEQRLSSEQVAREQAEKRAQKEQEEAGVKIGMLLEKLQKAQEETENLKKQMGSSNKCVIL